MFRVNLYHEEDTELLSLTVFPLLIWNTKLIIPRTRCTCSRSHLFEDKCCEGTQDSLFFELDMGEGRTLRFMTGVYADDTLSLHRISECVLTPDCVLSACPLHTNSGCEKERRILIGPW